MRRNIIAISGTMAVEKGKIIEILLEEVALNLKYPLSTTSRVPRAGEQDGVNYHFITPDEFKKKILNERFVEYEEVFQEHFYGTEISEFEKSDNNFVFEISPEKINCVKQRLGASILTIFVSPVSLEKLRKRLSMREADSNTEIESRIIKAKQDLSYAQYFDLVVHNPLDGSKEYIDEILNAAHDFLFRDNSVILENETEGINVIGKTILEIEKRARFKTEGRYLFRGVTALFECKDTRKHYGKQITPYTHTISSGYLIRLVENENLTDEAAISYLISLLTEARRQFPSRYEGSDLEVLSDIQHNGGATCLIDFSKNILTSLWFACQDNLDKTGFLYIMDIQEELDKGTLVEIGYDEDRSIDTLLKELQVRDSQNSSPHFYLWYPKAINNRIVRQDSVFIFGLNTMVADNHAIKVIPIHVTTKKKIKNALEQYFNVSESTIYNDPVGFASANAKLKPIHKKSI